MKTLNSKHFAELFLSKAMMIDVRAPIEYHKGAFPSATNLPILNDSERQQVGHYYKNQGQVAAIQLGHELVSGETKRQRIQAWKKFINKHPAAILYCFRGGMRSKLSQQWLEESGCNIAIVEGGYKALRRFLIGTIEEYSNPEKLIIIGGKTGTGKTRVIHKLDSSIDLEGLANHRGSAFGKHPTPQPTQIDFENSIGIELLKLKHNKFSRIMVEDESKLIGKTALPQSFKKAMSQSELVVVEESLEERIQIVLEEYVIDLIEQYKVKYCDLNYQQVFKIYEKVMLDSLRNIQKRIGGKRHKQLEVLMTQAMQSHLLQNDLSKHHQWIRPLLSDYYDKMYDYQLSLKKRRTIYTGNRAQVIAFLQNK